MRALTIFFYMQFFFNILKITEKNNLKIKSFFLVQRFLKYTKTEPGILLENQYSFIAHVFCQKLQEL